MDKKGSNIILGIDPGTARMGYGVIRHDPVNTECLTYGVISTPAGIEQHLRLKDIYQELTTLIQKYNPAVVAIEDIFYAKNKKTVIAVAQARGIALLAAAQNHKTTYSFTPLQIKQAVTSYGQADKKQVQHMVQKLLKLAEMPKPDDAADALAIALCCAHSLPLLSARGAGFEPGLR